jgi:hypothetical protein
MPLFHVAWGCLFRLGGQNRRRFGMQEKRIFLAIPLTLHYLSLPLGGQDRRRLNNGKKKTSFLLAIVFSLHYLCG